MITLILNNNKCKIECTLKLLLKIRLQFRIRTLNYFYSPAYRERKWDGYQYYITEAGYFETGMLPKIYTYLKENKYKIEIIDHRDEIRTHKLPEMLGVKTPRYYQKDAVLALIENRIGGKIKFQRGIIDGATNFGKLLLCVLIYKAFRLPTVFIPNSVELFEQALEELEEFIPGEIGQISSKKIEWNKFMVCMPITMNNRKHLIKAKLEGYKVLLIDEGDLSTSKTYQSCINAMYNAVVKVCVSGTVFMHKDKTKNETLRAHFGEIIYSMKKKELIAAGVSCPLSICIVPGNLEVKIPGDYKSEYDLGIVKNRYRHKRIYQRVNHFLKLDQYPQLLIAKDRKHIQRVYNYLCKKLEGHGWVIEWVDHERKDRAQISQDYKDGKIDILVGSMIYKRGKNFPLTRYVANIGGGDSMRTLLQIMGRAERAHESKSITHFDDFYDTGAYLQRHSKHRVQAIKDTKLEFKELHKDAIRNR